MKCPKCGLYNPDETIKCDCGYDFTKNDYKKELKEGKKNQKGLIIGASISQIIAIITLLIIYPYSKTFSKPIMYFIAFNFVSLIIIIIKTIKK